MWKWKWSLRWVWRNGTRARSDALDEGKADDEGLVLVRIEMAGKAAQDCRRIEQHDTCTIDMIPPMRDDFALG